MNSTKNSTTYYNTCAVLEKNQVKPPFVENLLFFALIGTMFLPAVPFFGGISIGIDDLIILPLFPVIFIMVKGKILKNPLVSLYFLLLMSQILSMVVGYYLLNVPKVRGDINTVIKNTKYLLVILCVPYFGSSEDASQKLLRILELGSYIIITVGIIQFLNLVGLGNKLNRIYGSAERVLRLLESSTNRVILTTPNPNTGAALSIYFLLFNFVVYFMDRKVKNLILALLLFIILFFTSSRTAFLGAIFAVAVFVLANHSIKRGIKILTILVFAAVGLLLIPQFAYLYNGLIRALEGTNTSLLVRYTKWGEALYLFSKSPIVGWGPAEAVHTTLVDGEYFLFLRRFGIVGTLFLLSTIYYTPVLYLKNRNKVNFSKSMRIISQIIVMYSIVATLLMITLNFYSGYKLFLPYWIMASIISYHIIKEKREINEKGIHISAAYR